MAALVKVLYKNRGLAGTWSATTAVATLPASNLADANRQRKYRGTSLAAQRIEVDLTAAYAIGAVAFVSHNFTSAASIAIKGNTSASWGAPAFSATLTAWDDKDSDVLVKFLDAAQTYRYWAFEPTDAANPDGYFEVGVIALGPVLSMAAGPQRLKVRYADASVVEYSPAGTPKTYELPIHAEVDVPVAAVSQALAFGDVQTAVRDMGQRRDVVLSVFASDPGADDISKTLNLYGRFVDLAPLEDLQGTAGGQFALPGAVFRESL